MDRPDEPLDGPQTAAAVLDWVEWSGDRERLFGRLARYAEWLSAEAVRSGGIGPGEASRIWRRHLADSLAFLAALPTGEDIVDVGSGVGLPGIPLALAAPHVNITLLDRSERRCWLARRAVRVLALENVEVICGDAARLTLPHRVAVSRAVRSVEVFFEMAKRLLPQGILAVTAVSADTRAAPGSAWEVVEIPPAILGRRASLVKVSLSN